MTPPIASGPTTCLTFQETDCRDVLDATASYRSSSSRDPVAVRGGSDYARRFSQLAFTWLASTLFVNIVV